VGGTYTSASFIDNWQNQVRILRGTNAGSTGLVAQWNLHTLQMQLPAYTGASSFAGTATANLAVDSGGNVITVSTAGGTVFPYTGNAVITGSLTVTQPIYVPINGNMYFQGGDDAALYDVNIVNTMGIYGVQDVTVGAVKLGSNGPILYGSGSTLGIGTTSPNAKLHVRGVGSTSATTAIEVENSSSTSILTVLDDGKVGIGTTPSETLEVNGTSLFGDYVQISGATNAYNQLRIRDPYTPSSTGDTNGQQGNICWDDDYIYVKTSAGWKRSGLSTF
jgi:hypothetical protein